MVLETIYNNPILEAFFLMPEGILALSALIPLIILYLIKPKPKTQEIPSLMFLVKQGSKITKNAFLRTLMKDLLLIIHILALLLFALAIMQPFVEVNETVLAQHSIIVIDASASMQTKVGLESRWDKAIKIAKENLGSTNTIVLAGATPQVLLEKGRSGRAKQELNNIQPKETITNLYDAVLLAGEFSNEGKVVIISDFIDTDTGTDIITPQKALEAKGLAVQLESVIDEAKNIGITDVNVKEDTTTVTIKNYNEETREVTIKVQEQTTPITLEGKATETISFNTLPNIAKIELQIQGEDHLEIDNTAYTSAPSDRKLRALLITNQQDKYLPTLINLLDNIELEVGVPPKIPNINHDIIIFRNLNTKLILPGSFKDALKQAKEKGASVIITAQQESNNIDYRGTLPVKLGEEKNKSIILKAQENEITKDIEFGTVPYYFEATENEDTITLARAEDGSALISLQPIGAGMLVYYGIDDLEAGLKSTPYYPIFWKRLLDFITKTPNVRNLNYDTGSILTVRGGNEIKTPKTTIKDNTILMDYQGIYELPDRKAIANLNSAKESDINGKFVTQKARILEGEETQSKRPKNLINYLIIIIMVVLYGEIFFLKNRGDI